MIFGTSTRKGGKLKAFSEKYEGKRCEASSGDKPCAFVDEVLRLDLPSVVEVVKDCDFGSCADLLRALKKAWWLVATDAYLNNKKTQVAIPAAKILLSQALKMVGSPDFEKRVGAVADGLWLQLFQRRAMASRRAEMFGNTDAAAYAEAVKSLREWYGFTDGDIEAFRYFVCQAKRESDPALNRSLYLYSKEKMTGKTTVARMVAGILNGCQSWRECQRCECLSDIPTELQFSNFARPKAAQFFAVVMDEAFAGKTTAKYYGKFKTAMTSDTASVEVKFGGKYDVSVCRNYIFTSNNDISSVVADESERRMFVIPMRKPKTVDYDTLYDVWRAFVVNAEGERDVAQWYRDTTPDVVGEQGVIIADIVSALLSDEFRGHIELRQAGNGSLYQVSWSFFTDFLSRSFDVRKGSGLCKEAIVRAFGEPNKSGNRSYYNVSDIADAVSRKDIIINEINDEELPY